MIEKWSDTEMVMTGADNIDSAPDFGDGDADLLDLLNDLAVDEIENELDERTVDISELDDETKEALGIKDEEMEVTDDSDN